MIVALATVSVRCLVETRASGYICFNTDDRLDAFFFADFVELDRAVHVAVVGEGDGSHVVFLGDFDHVVELGQSVQEGIVTMSMEMDELG